MQPLLPVAVTHLADYHYRTYRIVIDPAKTPITDIFRPQYWVNATKLAVDDRIRVIALDKSFDFEIVVVGKQEVGGGLVVDLWPRYPQGLGQGAAEQAKAIADAADVVKRELVASTVGGKPVPRVEQVGVDGWRVIGLDGTVHSKNHRSESAANVAMSKMLNQLGITEAAPEKAKPGKAA